MIITERYCEEVEQSIQNYWFVNDDGTINKSWGYGFNCLKDGSIIDSKNLERAAKFDRTGFDENGRRIVKGSVQTWTTDVWHPAIMQCNCGNHVELDGDVECDECGQWYNSSGQKLRNPEEWGEETGERFDSHGYYVGGGDY